MSYPTLGGAIYLNMINKIDENNFNKAFITSNKKQAYKLYQSFSDG